jgi:multidrug efflux pump subunit AcrA (membrane-fusion protein)
VNAQYADILKIGKTVSLHNIERTKNWTGKVNRLNPLIDANSQTIKAYIQVSGKDLREGQYMEADLTAKEEANTYEVSRKLIVDNDKLFVLKQDTLLKLMPIEPVYFKENTVVVRGLADGTKMVSRLVPGGYDGMVVKELKEN